jgi:peroxiredoxin
MTTGPSWTKFCLALLAAVAPLGCATTTDGKGAEAPSALVGNPAPPFRVKAVKNASGTLSLADLRGKVILLDLWGTYCPPCEKSFPKLQDLQARYGGSGLAVVAISVDEADSKAKIPGWVDAHGAKFAIGWDEDKAVGHAYSPETIPSSFLIDKRGVVRWSHAGFVDGDEAQFETKIKELLAQ